MFHLYDCSICRRFSVAQRRTEGLAEETECAGIGGSRLEEQLQKANRYRDMVEVRSAVNSAGRRESSWNTNSWDNDTIHKMVTELNL